MGGQQLIDLLKVIVLLEVQHNEAITNTQVSWHQNKVEVWATLWFGGNQSKSSATLEKK